MSELPPRYPLILNPKAKSEKGRRALKFIMAHATRFVIHATRTREEAIALARQFAAEGEPLVIAAGGDGTLNAVIEGLAGSDTVLGVFPTGTMNVFAREMGIPFDRLEEALKVIDHGHSTEVDLFEMNGAPFVQMAGVGFDAQVIEETTWERKKRFGPLAYLITAIKVLRTAPPTLKVKCADGRELTGVALLIGNGSLYGGQFRLFRKARNSDQLLDVIVFREAGYRFLRECLSGFFSGFDPDLPRDSVTYVQSATVRVTCREEVPVEIDGELWGRTASLEFRQTAKTLRVFVPRVPRLRWRDKLLKKLIPWLD